MTNLNRRLKSCVENLALAQFCYWPCIKLIAICFFVQSGPGSLAGGPQQASRPNVLVISIDDLNDWIGCLNGHPQVQTPHMDSLAARGTLFSNAHCQSPLCNPSRTSVMTGLRPTTTGIYGLAPWFRTLPEFENLVTLPQYFREHGYRTLTGGKIYHDAYPPLAARGDTSEFDV